MAPTPYDTNIKFLLADKQILARILKYAVQEFKDMTIEDIMSSIGEDIEIGTRPLDAGLSNMGRVNVSSTEDNIPGEGKIFFDIRFTAYHKETEMKFLTINEQIQKIAQNLSYQSPDFLKKDMPRSALIYVMNPLLLNVAANKCISILKGHGFTTAGTCNQMCQRHQQPVSPDSFR